MSSKVVPKILEELYEVQPSLREREIEAIRVIELMKENSPKLEINDDFHTSLRQRLLDEAQVLAPKRQRFYSNWKLYYLMYLTAFASFFIGIFFWGIFGKDIDLNPRIDTSPRGIIMENRTPSIIPVPEVIEPNSWVTKEKSIPEVKLKASMRLMGNEILQDAPSMGTSMGKMSIHQDDPALERTHSWLTEEARALFHARLDAIPTEKKASTLKLIEVQIQKQIDTAMARWTKKLITKLQDMLDIVHEEQGNTEDTSLIDDLLSGHEK